jgi:hypothetical protein
VRSMRRPAPIDRNVGSSANSDISTPESEVPEGVQDDEIDDLHGRAYI